MSAEVIQSPLATAAGPNQSTLDRQELLAFKNQLVSFSKGIDNYLQIEH
jgi:hypothetical protein